MGKTKTNGVTKMNLNHKVKLILKNKIHLVQRWEASSSDDEITAWLLRAHTPRLDKNGKPYEIVDLHFTSNKHNELGTKKSDVANRDKVRSILEKSKLFKVSDMYNKRTLWLRIVGGK